MTNSKVDHLLDLRGKVCPYPTLDTRLTLDKMAVGEILEVILDYYPARQTIPNLMCDLGYPCAFHEENQYEFHFTIHKIQ